MKNCLFLVGIIVSAGNLFAGPGDEAAVQRLAVSATSGSKLAIIAMVIVPMLNLSLLPKSSSVTIDHNGTAKTERMTYEDVILSGREPTERIDYGSDWD